MKAGNVKFESRFDYVVTASIVADQEFFPRLELNEDAVVRYEQLFRDGKRCPPLRLQSGTNRVIDGFHRLAAARRAGIKELPCNLFDVSDTELRSLSITSNRDHGVPLSVQERDGLIMKLYLQDGRTEQQIADILLLSKGRVSQVLASLAAKHTKNDKRRKLTPEDELVVVRLILKDEPQSEIARRFGVSDGLVSQLKSKYWDSALSLYTGGKLKREVAAELRLGVDDIDAMLLSHYRMTGVVPLNFKPEETTLWPSFGLDERFGMRYPGNLPGLVVKNLLCRLTKPGDMVLDPFSGGGTTLDACADMVDLKCESFDLQPKRPDIRQWNILRGPPPVSREPDFIFLDPPYGPVEHGGKYSSHEDELSELRVPEFNAAVEKLLAYWDHGKIAVMMANCNTDGYRNFYTLVSDTVNAMQKTGWKLHAWICNDIGRAFSVDGRLISRMDRANEGRGWWRWQDRHILIAEKTREKRE